MDGFESGYTIRRSRMPTIVRYRDGLQEIQLVVASLIIAFLFKATKLGTSRCASMDEQNRKADKEARKKSQQAERLTRARESTLDCRMAGAQAALDAIERNLRSSLGDYEERVRLDLVHKGSRLVRN